MNKTFQIKNKKNVISIKKAAVHNLKNISLDIPRNTFTVFTGISGSGKSSLAYDTIFKEGQRRYLASMSAYARQFLNQMERPEVDLIEGLSPTISIDQKSAGRNPRSTVGTITEVYDFLRLLFARLGLPQCPKGHGKIEGQTPEVMIEHIIRDFKDLSIFVLAPIVQERKGEYRKELAMLQEQGFSRARIDGVIRRLDEKIVLERYEKHTIEVAFDYFLLEDKSRTRLDDAVHKALDHTGGVLSIQSYDRKTEEMGLYKMYTKNNACRICGTSILELEPRLFSFNSPQGWCENCHGLGYSKTFIPERLVKDEQATIFKGALHLLNEKGNIIYTHWGEKEITQIAKKWRVSLKEPWKKLPKNFQERILSGIGRDKDGIGFYVIESLEYLCSKYNMSILEKYQEVETCRRCGGNKLNHLASNVLFKGKVITDLEKMQIKEIKNYFGDFVLEDKERLIGEPIVKEIKERLDFLSSVGLDYLTLNRRANSLSGGESQRIRLASQVGSGLEGCLYILDEPSIGLHQADNKKLIRTLKYLRDKSNTVYVIEHDEDTILAADHVVDIGPGAGVNGGEVLFNDNPRLFYSQIDKERISQTIEFLSGQKLGKNRPQRPFDLNHSIHIKGAQKHNLKNISLNIPLGVLTVICGVSGSGKSTLISDVLKNALLGKAMSKEVVASIEVQGQFNKFIEINQKPIGRTPRSNPATYTKAFGFIRDLFAKLPESKFRGYKVGRFSFNVKGGRCEECGGSGVIEVDMQLFATNEVVCETCNGRRFNQNTLDIHYRGQSIFDVLEMSISEAAEFFKDIPRLCDILSIMKEIGLGYLKLGQPSTTLSGGEAQRIKLASELGKKETGKAIYLLDEPTTGLHFEDMFKLLDAINRLVNRGNTVIIIEHNLDIINAADFLLELGPEGGDGGGELLFSGRPEDLAKKNTPTGKELKIFIERHEKRKQGYYLNKVNFNTLFAVADKNKAHKGELKVINQVISIQGLKKNNLKNISLTFPKNKLIAITGPSGSGKTSLAFDTIFQEGQRKYIESLSTYARRFLGRIPPADADAISGISPAIAVDQKAGSKNPRSTLATYTEMYDSLRVLYANVGTAYCPFSGEVIRGYSPTEAAKIILDVYLGKRIVLLAPLYISHIKINFLLGPDKLKNFIGVLLSKGYLRIFLEKKILHLENDREKIDELIAKNKNKPIDVYVVIDRLRSEVKNQSRIIEDIEKAYDVGEGILAVWDEKEIKAYASFPLAFESGFVLPEKITPRHFSFNHHLGSCRKCQGIGFIQIRRRKHSGYTKTTTCPECLGSRLDKKILSIKLGEKNITEVTGLSIKEARDFFKDLSTKLSPLQIEMVSEVLDEINFRLHHLVDLGLYYLTLDRTMGSLSGGEVQRLRLSTQIGNKLNDVVYVFDEPTIGLHERDTHKLLESLKMLRDRGNTVILVEHDGKVIKAVDHVIDIGPGAGHEGGEIVCNEKNSQSNLKPSSIYPYLYGQKKQHIYRSIASKIDQKKHPQFVLSNIQRHNVKNLDVNIPLNCLVGISGVSGSGKSSLVEVIIERVREVIYDGYSHPYYKKAKSIKTQNIDFWDGTALQQKLPFENLIEVDQSPVSTSSRSTISSYMDLLNDIRDIFAASKMARERGFDKGHFSFNTNKGYCSECQGRGVKEIEMHFISDVSILCDVCKGRRYRQAVLEVFYKGKSIADVLDMTVREAHSFFANLKKVRSKLQVLLDTGLGYLKLGLGTSTLSGGELQRIKLSKELAKSHGISGNLYVLDEPTTGLHFQDIEMLVKVIDALVKKGNTFIVIEHNREFLRNCDYLIDMGPGAGPDGGGIVYQGTIDEVKRAGKGFTYRYL